MSGKNWEQLHWRNWKLSDGVREREFAPFHEGVRCTGRLGNQERPIEGEIKT